MASRKLYQRKWREANPDYNNGKLKLAQRHCKECNVEVGRGKHRCPECMIIHNRARARANYKYTPEMAAKARKWREDNPDKVEEYSQIKKQQRRDIPRHCKECNGDVEYHKQYCPECLSIRAKAQKKIANDKAAGYRKERYDNRDKDAYNAYAREYQRGKKFRDYMREYQRNNKDKINEYVRNRYQNDYEYRERMKHNWRKAYYRKKQNWYQLRVERIDKLKVYLEENK